MKLIDNWPEQYVPDDTFRSPFLKQDLVYLLIKFTRKRDGTPPTRSELMKLKRKQLTAIWLKMKPFSMDLPPEEVRAA